MIYCSWYGESPVHQIVPTIIWPVKRIWRSIANCSNTGGMFIEQSLNIPPHAFIHRNSDDWDPYKIEQTSWPFHKIQQQRNAIQNARMPTKLILPYQEILLLRASKGHHAHSSESRKYVVSLAQYVSEDHTLEPSHYSQAQAVRRYWNLLTSKDQHTMRN